MNGRAFREESKTVGVDGQDITDAAVKAAVTNAVRRAKKPAEPKRSLAERIGDAYDATQQIDEALIAHATDIHDPRKAISYDGARVTATPENAMPVGSKVLHRAWLECQQGIDAAHLALSRLGWATRWQLGRRDVPTDEWVLRRALSILRSGLTWMAKLEEAGKPFDRPTAYEVCGQVGYALKAWPWHRNPPENAPTPMCTNKVNGCTNEPRPGGSQCSTCANYRSKYGTDRIVGEDGRTVRKAS